MATVFYSRCKPHRISAVQLALDNNIVFVGYPLVRAGAAYQPHHLSNCVVDLKANDEEWYSQKGIAKQHDPGYTRMAQRNRNLALEIEAGDIALMPDAENGVVYAGVVKEPGFRLVDNPPWYQQLLDIWRAAGRATHDHPEDDLWLAAEVAQVCEVERFVPIALSELPGWVRVSLFGRSTHGRVKISENGDPHPVVLDLMAGHRVLRDWTIDPEEVRRRLSHDMGPATFEHLIVSLLQLEQPEFVWRQLGGPGDGGIDGAAADKTGAPAGVVQCKLHYWGENVYHRTQSGSATARWLAALHHPENMRMEAGVRFLGIPDIVALVLKHSSRLPLAITMRVGAPATTIPDAPVAH